MPVWDHLDPVREAREFERVPPQPDDPQRLFVLGDPGKWRVSPISPWGTYWDASEGRAIRKATDGDGNFLTNAMNLLGRSLGYEPAAVPIEDQVMAANLLEVSANIPLSPVQRDIRPIYRDRVDPTFNVANELKRWREDNPELATIIESRMTNLDDLTKNANNQEWFKYVINLSLSRIQAEQRIEERNRRIGTMRWLGEAGLDGFGNYLLADPTFIPSLAFLGGTPSLAKGAIALADDIARWGARSSVPGSGIISRGAAPAVKWIGSAPALVHGGLASRIGYASALGVELGAYGAVLDTAAQLDMMHQWNQVFGGTNQEREFNWNELFLMTGLMGAFGFATGGAAGGFLPDRVRQMREGITAATNGDIDSRAARRGFSDPASAVAMQREDVARVDLLNKLQRIVEPGSSDASASQLFYWMFNREVINEHGLGAYQIADMVDNFRRHMEDVWQDFSDQAMSEFMVDLMLDAKRYNDERGITIPRSGPSAIRWRRSWHQAEEEMTRLADPPTPSTDFYRSVYRRALEMYAADVPVARPGELLSKAKIANMQEEVRDLVRLQGTRGLTTDEEAQLLNLEEILTFQNALPEVAKRVTMNLDGWNPTIAFDLDKFQPTTEVSRTLLSIYKRLRNVNLASQELAKIKARGRERTTLGIRISARLQARIDENRAAADRLLKKMERIASPESGKSLMEIVAEQALKPLITRQERIDAIVARKSSIDAASHMFVTDIHAVSTILRAWGLGDQVAKLVLHKTGQPITTRAAFAAVREASHFVDQSKITVDALGPNGPIHAGTLMDARRNAERLLEPLNGFIQNLFESKQIRTLEAWQSWQREAILHAHNLVESQNSTVIEAVRMWREIADNVAAEGGANGRLTGKIVESFFPVRVSVGKLRKDSITFHSALVESWTRRWMESEELNPEILVRMGWARRTVTEAGTIKYFPDGPFATQKKVPKDRAVLSPDQEAEYQKALLGTDKKYLDDRGESALQTSAWRAINGMLDQRTFDQGKDGVVRFTEPVPETAEFQRAIDPEMLADPELQGFFDFNFMDIAYDYVRTTGFEVKATTAVQRLTGVVGATVDDYFDAMQIVAEKGLRRGGNEQALVNAGMNQLRSKWLMMQGKSPRYVAEAEGIGEVMAEAAIAGTTAVYGGGIGTLITFTEAFIQTFARIYEPHDFFDNMARGFRSIISSKERRQALEDMATGLQLNRTTSAERFTSGAQGSNFHYRLRDKLTEPYRDFWDAFTGRTLPGGRLRNRYAHTAISGVKAIGKTMLTIGGTDFMSNYARVMLVHTATRETARFLPAALKLSQILEAEQPAFQAARQAARQAALTAGRSQLQAARIGDRAYHKLWRNAARRAGFGGRWQVADRFNRAGLMNSRKLRTFIDTAKAQGNLTRNGLDLTEVARNLGGLQPADRFLVSETVNQLHNSIEDLMRKRVSEQGPLQTPTDAPSLTYHGRVMNTMFAFPRSFVDNNVIDLAHLPQREGALLMTGFIVGEVMGQVARQLLKGRSLKDLEREWEENPKAALASYILRVPLLGQATPILQTFADAALDGKRYKQQAGRSAATSMQDTLLNLAADSIAVPAEIAAVRKPRVISGLDKLSIQMVPGLGLFRRALGDDSMDRIRGGTPQSWAKFRQAMDYTQFRSRVAGGPELRDPDSGLNIEEDE